RGELPVLLRTVYAIIETFALLLLRHVQEELQDRRAVARQVTLEGVDVLVAVLPELLAVRVCTGHILSMDQLGMHPGYQHFLVVRTIEYPDPSTLGQVHHAPPEEVVIQLLRSRMLEREHLRALRIHATHHVLDRAVLSRGVHRLEDEQHRPRIIGILKFLRPSPLLHALPERRLRQLLPL